MLIDLSGIPNPNLVGGEAEDQDRMAVFNFCSVRVSRPDIWETL